MQIFQLIIVLLMGLAASALLTSLEIPILKHK